MSDTREKYPLSKKKIYKKTLSRSLLWAILLVPPALILMVIGVAISHKTNNSGVSSSALIFGGISLLIVLLLITLANYLYQKWYFATYFYDFDEHYVVIRKNPITPHEITLPFQRVQDVYVDQDLLDRLFGLYDLHLSTATSTSAMEAHIDGMEKPAAEAMRDDLLGKIHSKLTGAHDGK